MSTGSQKTSITIWDPIVRICHWGLVTTFVINYFLVEPGRLVHEISGYGALSFVVIRIVWGLSVSSASHASVKQIDISADAVNKHLRHIYTREMPTNSGHNPFGWLMIISVILLITALGVTGFLMEEVDALFGNSTLEYIHGTVADTLYIFILIHVAAVFFLQYRVKTELIKPMFTGKRTLRK